MNSKALSLRQAAWGVLPGVMIAIATAGCGRPAHIPRAQPAAADVENAATYLPVGTTLTPKDGEFQFAIVSDRTGGHRPGVFESALKKLNLLRPDFVMSVGDLIEGYSTDPTLLDQQWQELIGFIHKLEMPFHFVPGNHDISNATMDALWRKNFGPPYNHFMHRGVLFLTLNTQGGQSGVIDEEQITYVRRTLAEHKDARWTLVFFHQPVWTYRQVTNWERVEALLSDRPYTVFAGHMHRYNHEQRNGRDYYVLGTSGGASPLRGVNYGEFDHVAWVTMTAQGPRVANLLLDGIWDQSIYTDAFETELRHQFGFTLDAEQKLNTEGDNLSVPPLIVDNATFERGVGIVTIHNPSDYPLTIAGRFEEQAALHVWPGSFQRELPAHSATSVTLEVTAPMPTSVHALAPLKLTAQFTYPMPGRPAFTFEQQRALLVLDRQSSATQWSTFSKQDAFFGAESLIESGRAAEARGALRATLPRVANAEEILRGARLAQRVDPQWEPAPAMGFITDWELSGPYAWNSEQGVPQLPATTQPEQAEPGLATAAWRPVHTQDATGKLDLNASFGAREEACGFARAEIEIDEATDAVLRVGSDDGLRIWLNGKLVHQLHAFRGVVLDQDRVAVRLQAGFNQLTLQVMQSREGWGFALRVTDPAGQALRLKALGEAQTAAD